MGNKQSLDKQVLEALYKSAEKHGTPFYRIPFSFRYLIESVNYHYHEKQFNQLPTLQCMLHRFLTVDEHSTENGKWMNKLSKDYERIESEGLIQLIIAEDKLDQIPHQQLKSLQRCYIECLPTKCKRRIIRYLRENLFFNWIHGQEDILWYKRDLDNFRERGGKFISRDYIEQ